MATEPICIRAFQGLGDTIYQRPFLAQLAHEHGEVWVATSWPQLFHDLRGVRCVDPRVVEPLNLRTQRANAERSLAQGLYRDPPPGATWRHVGYDTRDFRAGRTITQALERSFGFELGEAGLEACDLTVKAGWVRHAMSANIRHGARLGVTKPSTIRHEWPAPGRTPPTGCLQAAIDANRRVKWCSIGWVKRGEEEYVEGPLEVVEAWNYGQLSIEQLIALVWVAPAAVTGCGFLVPLALALRVPLFYVAGGAFDPKLVMDPRLVRSPVGVVESDSPCYCADPRHDCPRDLTPERTAAAAAQFWSQIP